jgi:predicted glycosyltransferase
LSKRKKRIWVDVLTPKQALFAKAMVERSPSNVELVITTRNYSELNKFVRQLGLRGLSFGKHGGSRIDKKLEASIERMKALVPFVRGNGFDSSLSFISPEAARVSFGFGLVHYICSDSPHAVAPSRLAVPLASKVFSPFPINKARWTQYGLKVSQVFLYHALDPWVWLSSRREIKPKRTRVDGLVTIRLEESFASYSKSGRGVSNQLRGLISKIRSTGDFGITIIPRYDEQRAWAKKQFGKTCTIPDSTVNGVELISYSDLLIGGGGTMTQEAALMGVPNISYFPSSELDVFENFYFPKKLSLKASSASELFRLTTHLLSNIDSAKKQFSERARKAVQGFEDPVKFIFQNTL